MPITHLVVVKRTSFSNLRHDQQINSKKPYQVETYAKGALMRDAMGPESIDVRGRSGHGIVGQE